LLESRRVGGTSINYGPAPVRTLARAARLLRDVKSWQTFGLHGTAPKINVRELLENAKRVASYAHDKLHLVESLRSRGIIVEEGIGPVEFVDQNTVRVKNGRKWQAQKIIIAVGGHSRIPGIPGAKLALTYEDIWNLETLPARVGIVGAAATGCQLASIFQDFGSEVYLFELSPKILPQEDESVSLALAEAFEKRGMKLKTGASTVGLEKETGGIKLRYSSEGKEENALVDAVFFATGWTGNIETLNAAAAELKTERGYIRVDSSLRTNIQHIFAVGDVNGLSMLVQSARKEGRISAENAVLDRRKTFSHDIVPAGSFTDPEYASVGLTEFQARSEHECVVGIANYRDLLRPVIDDRMEGFCKVIADSRTHRILGAHVIGEYSVEIIQMVAACMEGKMTVDQVAELDLAYPTFTEAVSMAAQKIVRELNLAPFPKMWN